MAKKQLGFRVPDNTYKQFEEYRDEGTTKSDAARRLLERGLDAEQTEYEQPGLWPYLFLSISSVLLGFAFMTTLLPVLFSVPMNDPLLAVSVLVAASVASSVAALRAAGQSVVDSVAKMVGRE